MFECVEVAIFQQINLWEGKSASKQPCESSTLHRITVGRSFELQWRYEGGPIRDDRIVDFHHPILSSF